jgi:oligopeptide/dipeptide ABC transporter ATP-binding protein
MTTPLLSVEDLGVDFTRGGVTVHAVDGVSFTIARGQTLGLVGESGCGKSTVAKAVVRLLRPSRGRVVFDGRDLAGLGERELRPIRPRVQMIFQDPQSSLDPRMTVRDVVDEPLAVHRRGSRAERRGRVDELMELVGLSSRLATRYAFQLSGGQQQRVAIARALALSPDLVVADEPTSALDVSIQAQILTLLADLQRELSLAYLFISHDLGAVRQLADEVVVMYLGRVCETGATQDVLDRPGHPYTAALLSAAPVPDPEVEARRERIVLRGDVPSPADPPQACRFHTRCWLRADLGGPEICATVDPPAVQRDGAGRAFCHFSDHLTSHPDGADRAGIPALEGDTP